MRFKPLPKLNPKSGTTPHWEYTFPEGFILIVDTREVDPLFLKKPPKDLTLVRKKLDYGDYSVLGFEHEIAIERKTISDLYGSCFGDWDRFLRELECLSQYQRKYLVVEGTEDEVLRYQDYSRVHPNSMRGRLVSIEIRLGIPIYFYANRRDCERHVLDLLVKFYRVKRSN